MKNTYCVLTWRLSIVCVVKCFLEFFHHTIKSRSVAPAVHVKRVLLPEAKYLNHFSSLFSNRALLVLTHEVWECLGSQIRLVMIHNARFWSSSSISASLGDHMLMMTKTTNDSPRCCCRQTLAVDGIGILLQKSPRAPKLISRKFQLLSSSDATLQSAATFLDEGEYLLFTFPHHIQLLSCNITAAL